MFLHLIFFLDTGTYEEIVSTEIKMEQTGQCQTLQLVKMSKILW